MKGHNVETYAEKLEKENAALTKMWVNLASFIDNVQKGRKDELDFIQRATLYAIKTQMISLEHTYGMNIVGGGVKENE